jgi:hypothetical protein
MEIFTGSLPNQDNYTMEKGIVLSVHQRDQVPLVKYNSINVGVGDAAFVSLARSNYTKLGYPYSDCRLDVTKKERGDSVYFNMTLDMSKYYQKLCLGDQNFNLNLDNFFVKCRPEMQNVHALFKLNKLFSYVVELQQISKKPYLFDPGVILRKY